MRSDTEKAIKYFSVKTIGRVKAIEEAEMLLTSDESVLYCSPTNLYTIDNNTCCEETLPVILILTNKRVIYRYKVSKNEIVEFISLEEIRAVSSHGNGISGGHVHILTDDMTYDFLTSYKKSVIEETQEIFERAIENYMHTLMTSDTQAYISEPEISPLPESTS